MASQNAPQNPEESVRNALKGTLASLTEENLTPFDLQIQKTSERDRVGACSPNIVDVTVAMNQNNRKQVRNVVGKLLADEYGTENISTVNEAEGLTVRVDRTDADTYDGKWL